MKNQVNKVIAAIRGTQGRFFGLHTKSGDAFNAQLVKETPNGIRFYDRNRREERLVHKTSIASVTSGGNTVSA
jgi:hypothetical protein